jgi:glucose-fructose oxidoreductase
MAVTDSECRTMIEACQQASVKLRSPTGCTSNQANLMAIDVARGGAAGGRTLLLLDVFTAGQGRQHPHLAHRAGGRALYDIGIYCINAARYLFQAEPTEVVAMAATRTGDDPLRPHRRAGGRHPALSGERLATFTVSFGAS